MLVLYGGRAVNSGNGSITYPDFTLSGQGGDLGSLIFPDFTLNSQGGDLGSLMFCEVGLRALVIKKGISDLEIKSGNESNGADFSFDVGEYVRGYLKKIGLRV